MDIERLFLKVYLPLCLGLLVLSFNIINIVPTIASLVIPITGILFILYGIRAAMRKKIRFYNSHLYLFSTTIFTGDAAIAVSFLCLLAGILLLWVSAAFGRLNLFSFIK